MAWIESHQELLAHHKLRKAAATLRISRPQMIGHLHCLWWWVLDYADDGDLSKFDVVDIALGAEWEGDPDKFVEALVECGTRDDAGFLERDGLRLEGVDEDGEPQLVTSALVVHDWWAHGGKLVVKRLRDAERARQRRAGQGTSNGRRSDDATTQQRQDSDDATHGRANTTQDDTTRDDKTTPPSGATRARGHRLPDDWRPDPEPELVKAIGGQDAAKQEFAKFGDYWRAQPGAKGRKVDWQATWRNWLRRAGDDRRSAGARASPPAAATTSTFTESRRLQ